MWSSGTVRAVHNVGGLVGSLDSVATIVASYSTAAVECTGLDVSNEAGGLAGVNNGGTIVTSYSTGTVQGACRKNPLSANYIGSTVTASYWDTTLSGINDDSDNNPPEGITSANLRLPTGYSGIYSDWDDQDVDDDGTTGRTADPDDDAWDFGTRWQLPVLKFGGLDVARQIALQPNAAPTFDGAIDPFLTFRVDYAIDPLRIPAASGGEGPGGYTYGVDGLPMGLSFGAPNCAARTICGTPTVTGTSPVTIHAHDGDDNRADSDRAVLETVVVVATPVATLTSRPSPLAEANLNGAEVTITLSTALFASGVTKDSFTLRTDVPGLTIGHLPTVTAGDDRATFTLAYDGTDFNTARTLAVTVAEAAHSLKGTLTTASVNVAQRSLEATVSSSTLALNEDSNHANNARTFTVTLDSVPATATTVTVASADKGAATVDKAALTFTTTDWATAQTVTVTAQADDDTRDESTTVTLAAAGVGALATVTVTVTDDDVGTVLIDAYPTTEALDPGPLLIDEEGAPSYTVRLSALPTANVTVAVVSDDSKLAVRDPSLTFTTQNWNTAQTVRLADSGDGDAIDESHTVTHTATGGGYGGTSATLRVAVTDDERTGTDYDVDNDGLIEVSTLAQLNAIRWDLDGDGSPASNAADYSGASGAFANASTDMGCPAVSGTATCTGYELTQDLDFDTDGDGSTHTSGASDSGDTYHNGGSGWNPIGPASAPNDGTHFNAVFDGNGHSIHNLYVNRSRNYSGLFAALRGGAVVRSLGLPNAHVRAGQGTVATLAGNSAGRLEAVWASGSAAGDTNVGGLAGVLEAGSVVVASYSKATATCAAANCLAGGLAAANFGSVVASYATGAVSGTLFATRHGLAGDGGLTTGAARLSHWDRQTSGVTASDQGAGRTTAQLQTPTSATGIFAGWDALDVDNDGDPHESPWHFGTDSQYPALRYRGMDPIPQRGDYDLDDDGLIDIRTLAQLNAVRWDMDGDGAASSGNVGSYAKAFRGHVTGMGCKSTGCEGYELENDLDFDTDGDGSTWTLSGSTFTADSGDAYYNGGSGWNPIGTGTTDALRFNTTFDGNGHVIENLLVTSDSASFLGLFGGMHSSAVVRSLGLPDAQVPGWRRHGLRGPTGRRQQRARGGGMGIWVGPGERPRRRAGGHRSFRFRRGELFDGNGGMHDCGHRPRWWPREHHCWNRRGELRDRHGDGRLPEQARLGRPGLRRFYYRQLLGHDPQRHRGRFGRQPAGGQDLGAAPQPHRLRRHLRRLGRSGRGRRQRGRRGGGRGRRRLGLRRRVGLAGAEVRRPRRGAAGGLAAQPGAHLHRHGGGQDRPHRLPGAVHDPRGHRRRRRRGLAARHLQLHPRRGAGGGPSLRIRERAPTAAPAPSAARRYWLALEPTTSTCSLTRRPFAPTTATPTCRTATAPC